jgi:hypothetical protein
MTQKSYVGLSRVESVLNALRKIIRYASESERLEVLDALKELIDNHPVTIPKERVTKWHLKPIDSPVHNS